MSTHTGILSDGSHPKERKYRTVVDKSRVVDSTVPTCLKPLKFLQSKKSANCSWTGVSVSTTPLPFLLVFGSVL